MQEEFFIQHPKSNPTIYAYVLPGVPSHEGFVKVGYTGRDVTERINEQTHTVGVSAKVLLKESAMRADGSIFTDKAIHRVLRKNGFRRLNEGNDRNEWFACSVQDVRSAILEVRDGITSKEKRTQDFKMRPEQENAVRKTSDYFVRAKKEAASRPAKFLWNAKMRFGKTFASYKLAQKMGFRRVLVLTFKPAVESAWRED